MIGAINGGWKVRIERPVACARLNFYIYKHVAGYTELMQPDNLAIRIHDSEYMDNIKPTFSLSYFDGMDIMRALAEALAEDGIKTPNDHKLQGMLDAQGAHLQDLRTLLKLNKTSGAVPDKSGVTK